MERHSTVAAGHGTNKGRMFGSLHLRQATASPYPYLSISYRLGSLSCRWRAACRVRAACVPCAWIWDTDFLIWQHAAG